MTGRIGVLGGTFDPVHYGHINPARHLADSLGLSRVLFVLSARPPHRDAPVAAIEHRMRMLCLGLQGYPTLEPDDREIDRPGPSYTLWTLRSLRSEYPDDSLCLILGADVFQKRAAWYRWEECTALANIVVLSRPGWTQPRGCGLSAPGALGHRRAGVVAVADAPRLPISATSIRQRAAAGADMSDVMPAAVNDYIREHHLYRANQPMNRHTA